MYLLSNIEESIKDINFELRNMHDFSKEQEEKIQELQMKNDYYWAENKELKDKIEKNDSLTESLKFKEEIIMALKSKNKEFKEKIESLFKKIEKLECKDEGIMVDFSKVYK